MGESYKCDTGRMYGPWAGHGGVMFGGVSHFFHYLQKTLWYCQAVPAPGTSFPHQFSVLLLLLSLRCKETPVYHTTSSTRAFAYQSISKFCPERHSTWIFTSSAALLLSDLFSASFFFFFLWTTWPWIKKRTECKSSFLFCISLQSVPNDLFGFPYLICGVYFSWPLQ